MQANLVNTARTHFIVTICEARSLKVPKRNPKQHLVDAYCVVEINEKEALRTEIAESTRDPCWNEKVVVGTMRKGARGDDVTLQAIQATVLKFTVWDKNYPPETDVLLGHATLRGEEILKGFPATDVWLPLKDEPHTDSKKKKDEPDTDSKKKKVEPEKKKGIRVKVEYFPK